MDGCARDFLDSRKVFDEELARENLGLIAEEDRNDNVSKEILFGGNPVCEFGIEVEVCSTADHRPTLST